MMLGEFNPLMSMIAFYNELFIQYGFVTLFVAACPLVRQHSTSLIFLHHWVGPLIYNMGSYGVIGGWLLDCLCAVGAARKCF